MSFKTQIIFQHFVPLNEDGGVHLYLTLDLFFLCKVNLVQKYLLSLSLSFFHLFFSFVHICNHFFPDKVKSLVLFVRRYLWPVY